MLYYRLFKKGGFGFSFDIGLIKDVQRSLIANLHIKNNYQNKKNLI